MQEERNDCLHLGEKKRKTEKNTGPAAPAASCLAERDVRPCMCQQRRVGFSWGGGAVSLVVLGGEGGAASVCYGTVPPPPSRYWFKTH